MYTFSTLNVYQSVIYICMYNIQRKIKIIHMTNKITLNHYVGNISCFRKNILTWLRNEFSTPFTYIFLQPKMNDIIFHSKYIYFTCCSQRKIAKNKHINNNKNTVWWIELLRYFHISLFLSFFLSTNFTIVHKYTRVHSHIHTIAQLNTLTHTHTATITSQKWWIARWKL